MFPDEGVVVVVAEGLVLEPLDRSDEVHLPGHRFAVSPDEVDLGVVLPVPPPADGLGLGPLVVGKQAKQRLADQWLDRPAAPGGSRATGSLA